MYKSILLPIDLSEMERGRMMIDVAQKLAGEDTRIRLLNVTVDIPAFVAAEVPNEVIKTAMKTARQTLEGLVTAAGIKADAEVRAGKPGPTILTSADECGADLIIIGSHKPGLQDYFLGSTAARVVRHAQCSVLVMR
ncbi:universal stress protein [Anderseniella sp. Alg231-50]|uniref:universal stress protein n=1 Tax=Anderseniella sp. Alg231-50 TaxID=1922226 RepID=UPI000D557A0C